MRARFSAVPTPADLQHVTFEDRSLDLRDCRPGDCPVRLSADDIARFHKEVNWYGRGLAESVRPRSGAKSWRATPPPISPTAGRRFPTTSTSVRR